MSSGRKCAPSTISKRCGRARRAAGGRADAQAPAMRLTIAAVGRLRDGPERELAERYRKRAEQLGRRIGLRDVEIVEVRESRAPEIGKRIIEESIAIANVIPDKAAIVILDEHGENLDSKSLATQLGKWRDAGRPAAVFVVGG